MESFYHKLKQLRQMKGFTIREVADRSGVSTAYISQLENGQRGVPSPDILKKLSEGLNIPYYELMKHAGYIEDNEAGGGSATNSAPVNLRRFIRNNELQFDGIRLSELDKEWLERVLTALFWNRKNETNHK